jgi:hypothetical protein
MMIAAAHFAFVVLNAYYLPIYEMIFNVFFKLSGRAAKIIMVSTRRS